MNALSSFFASYCDWIGGWKPQQLGFFLQATMLFGLPTLFCSITFRWGSRSVFVQTLMLVAGMLLAVSISAEPILPDHAVLKAWLVTICLVLLVFLPAILSRLLTPELGKQRKLQIVLYLAVAGLFLLNLFST